MFEDWHSLGPQHNSGTPSVVMMITEVAKAIEMEALRTTKESGQKQTNLGTHKGLLLKQIPYAGVLGLLNLVDFSLGRSRSEI